MTTGPPIWRRRLVWVRRACVVLAITITAAACSPPDQPASEVTDAASASAQGAAVREILEAAARLTEQHTSANVDAFVAAVAADGDQRWVPWLIDLLRVSESSAQAAQIGEVLADLTGIESQARIPNLIAHGSWSADHALDGGPGYREFKVALYSRIDDRFGDLLASVVDPVELAAIQWGGVPVGGIPELNEPDRVMAADADHMHDDEVVLGVRVDDAAVAYPLRILARHELANDTVGGRAIAVVYCTLCRSALVFDRRIGDQTVRFLTSGLLSNSNKIMVDVETSTLWSHLRGTGIGGPHAGRELELLPVVHMRWSDWVAEHPNTQVLTLPAPIFFDDPERPPIAYDYTVGEAYASYYASPELWFPIVEAPPVWPPKTEVVGIEFGDDALALSLAEINASDDQITVEVGGQLFFIEGTGSGARVRDPQGNVIIAEQSFWFAWYANHRNTRTLSPIP